MYMCTSEDEQLCRRTIPQQAVAGKMSEQGEDTRCMGWGTGSCALCHSTCSSLHLVRFTRFRGGVGYHICLTHRRSPVQSWAKSQLLLAAQPTTVSALCLETQCIVPGNDSLRFLPASSPTRSARVAVVFFSALRWRRRTFPVRSVRQCGAWSCEMRCELKLTVSPVSPSSQWSSVHRIHTTLHPRVAMMASAGSGSGWSAPGLG